MPDFNVTISALPNQGGAPITDIEYRVSGGAAVSTGGTSSFQILGVPSLSDTVEIRAINAFGAGPWSSAKSPAAWDVTLTGLTSSEARQGATIGLDIVPALGGETVTYQWTANGVAIGGATSNTFTVNIGTNVTDGQSLRCEVTIDGDTFISNAAPSRYAPGSVLESPLDDWIIDDDILDVSLAADFTIPNLTGTFVITGLPAGTVHDGDGTISGTATGTPATAALTCTFTDQYGRTVVGSYSVDTVYRTQATGGADLDLSFVEDSAIATTNLRLNWSDNGNTLTLVSVAPTLPAGLSVSSAGVLTGTPTTPTADATYTLTMEDEYGRETSDTFTLEITAAVPPATITINSVGPQQADGDVPVAYSIDLDDATVEAVLFLATDPDPVAADFNTGATSGYIDLGQVALTTAGSGIALSGPNGLQGNYKLAYLPTGGGDGDVAVSASFALDSTGSVLSPVSFTTGSGAGAVDWAFTPDEDSAAVTGYRVSIFADGSTPSNAAIRDGTGAIATTTGIASASVGESGTLTGSAGVVYVPAIYYIDAFGNEVFNTYADVTAGAGAGGVTVAQAPAFFINDGTNQTTFDGSNFTTAGGSNRMVLALVGAHFSSIDSAVNTVLSVSIGGVAMTQVSEFVQAPTHVGMAVFRLMDASIPAGASATQVVFDGTARSCTLILIEFNGVDQTTPLPTISSILSGTNFGGGITVAPGVTTGAANSALVSHLVFSGGLAALDLAVAEVSDEVRAQTGTTSGNDNTAGCAVELIPTAGAEAHTYSSSSSPGRNYAAIALEVRAA